VHILPGDMASHNSLTTAAELTAALLPSGLDILIVNGAYVNNKTAFLPPSAFASSSQAQVLHDDMHASLDTNVLGVVYSINAFLPLIEKGTMKKVVVISTGLADTDITMPLDGKDGNSVQVAYSAMKAALNSMLLLHQNTSSFARTGEIRKYLRECVQNQQRVRALL
jgi:NAD(P)-dependent dehydrogenase (short-subunit alcohol dehydrogenase family)